MGDVTILSPHTFENSGLQGENAFRSICSFEVLNHNNYRILSEDTLRFSTIHRFKGLESRVIILIDVEDIEDHKNRILNYTGISRAKVLLYILYPQKLKDTVLQRVANK